MTIKIICTKTVLLYIIGVHGKESNISSWCKHFFHVTFCLCELSGGGSPSFLNIFLTHLLLTVPLYTMLSTTKKINILLLLLTVPIYIIYISLQPPPGNIVTLYRRIVPIETNVLVEDHLWPPLNVVTVSQE